MTQCIIQNQLEKGNDVTSTEEQQPPSCEKPPLADSTSSSQNGSITEFQDIGVTIKKLISKDRHIRILDLKDVKNCFIQKQSKLSKNFLEKSSVSSKMRTRLVKWLSTLSKSLNFKSDTFFMTVSILDHYLCLQPESTNQLQLLGATCLYIASKLCESQIKAPEVYSYSASGIFSPQALLEKEKQVLLRLNFKTDFPAVWHFLKLLRNPESLSEQQFNECLYVLKFLSENDSYYYEHSSLELAQLIIRLVKKRSDEIKQGITYEKLDQEFRKYTL